MDFTNILGNFKEFYFKIDISKRLILECVPNYSTKEFPCSFEDFQDAINAVLPYEKMSEAKFFKVAEFLAAKDKSKGLSIRIGASWIAIDYRLINEEEYLRVLFISDTLERMKDEIEINKLDPLTKVYHRHTIKNYIADYITANPNKSCHLFMIDIDFFKNINDNFGHLFGDKVIIAISNALKMLPVPHKLIGRLGGDEFVIFVEDELDREQVKDICREIRYYLDNIYVDSNRFSVTSTIGVASYPKDASDFTGLYVCCDKALYRGKQKGRDCHIIYEKSLHENIDRNIRPTFTNVTTLSVVGFINSLYKKLTDKSFVDIFSISKDIATFFQLDRILVIEENRVVPLFEKVNYDDYDSYLNLNILEYSKYFIVDESLIINDCQTWSLRDKNVYDVFFNTKMISAVQNIHYDSYNKPTSIISFESVSNRRVWQRAEISYLIIIAGILKSFKDKM